MGGGVSFVDNGEKELNVTDYKTVPSEPSGSAGSDVKFVDNGSGDVTKSFDTSKTFDGDPISHDMSSGRDVTFVDEV